MREYIPPHNYEAEQALLAAVLTKNELFFRFETILAAADFADPLHGRIWTAIGELLAAGSRANFLTLKPRFDADPDLAKADPPGARYLAVLENAVVTIINAEDYAVQIRDLAVRRRAIIDAGEELEALHRDYERSAVEIIAERMATLERRRAETGRQSRMKRAVGERVFHVMDTPVARYETGIRPLDDSLGGGLHAGRFYEDTAAGPFDRPCRARVRAVAAGGELTPPAYSVLLTLARVAMPRRASSIFRT
jgi:replicative DNA helicase